MARKRRTSQVLETARQRLAGLKSINPEPNFGTALSLTGYDAMATAFGGKLENYNQQLAALDDQQNDLEADEDKLSDMNKRMLSATGAQYGEDSSEYEAIGGTRTSERKKPTRKDSGGSTPPPKP